MNVKLLAVGLVIFLSSAANMAAQSAGTSEPTEKLELNENLKCLAPYLGTWEIESEWAGGSKLWAKNVYEIGLGGNFVIAKTWAKDGDGEVYQRYMTIFAWDKDDQKIVSHGFMSDGKTQQVPMQVESSNGKERIRSQWQPSPDSPMVIKQEVSMIDENQYDWKVWSRINESAEFEPIMEGVWKRQTD